MTQYATQKIKLPGITQIRACLSGLAFAPAESKAITEMITIGGGGVEYLERRALEMYGQYLSSKNVTDLDMMIQALATVRVMKYGPVTPKTRTPRSGDSKGDNPPSKS